MQRPAFVEDFGFGRMTRKLDPVRTYGRIARAGFIGVVQQTRVFAGRAEQLERITFAGTVDVAKKIQSAVAEIIVQQARDVREELLIRELAVLQAVAQLFADTGIAAGAFLNHLRGRSGFFRGCFCNATFCGGFYGSLRGRFRRGFSGGFCCGSLRGFFRRRFVGFFGRRGGGLFCGFFLSHV